jgi:hypothetical protein
MEIIYVRTSICTLRLVVLHISKVPRYVAFGS